MDKVLIKEILRLTELFLKEKKSGPRMINFGKYMICLEPRWSMEGRKKVGKFWPQKKDQVPV